MPVTWKICDGVLIVVAIGAYDPSEMSHAIQEAIADQHFLPTTSLLLDGRSSLAYPSREQIKWRGEWIASLHREGLFPRTAIVAAPEPHRVRLAELTRDALRLQDIDAPVFTDKAAALRWLVREGSERAGFS